MNVRVNRLTNAILAAGIRKCEKMATVLPNCEELNIKKFVSHENEYPRLCFCLDNKHQSGKKAFKLPLKFCGHLAFLLNFIEFPKWSGSLPLSMVLKVFSLLVPV